MSNKIPANYMRPGGYNTSNNEINNRTNQTKLRNELSNLYGGRNGFLNSREINGFVGKLNPNSTNTLNIKRQAYKKAYTKYMNYMAGDFTQDIIKSIKAKMKSSPKCPSGVEGGGPSIGGTIRAVAGVMRAATSKQNQQPRRSEREKKTPKYLNNFNRS
tara:strand:+ start:676 stop:1152 length:477 start_codon:yes stop_codon:yes gene_type:complete